MTEDKYGEDHWWRKDEESKVNKLFDPKDIAVDIRNISVDYVLRKIERRDIDLFPAFQRRYDLWSNEAKSQLIESILLNFPIPPLYFDGSDPEQWVVVDGLQRLWTLKQFVLEKEFELTGLSVMTHLNGQYFHELERQYQRKIEEYALVVYLIKPGAPKFVIYDIFRRLNTGGVTLNAQEVRHALNTRASHFLDHLASYRDFSKLIPGRKKRMEDNELALRFCAFYLQHYKSYQPPMPLFLDEAMDELNNCPNSVLRDIEFAFHRTFTFIAQNFGTELFLRESKFSNRGFFNKALFEAWSVLLAKHDEPYLEKIGQRASTLMDLFNELRQRPDFIESISITTASEYAVMTRFMLLEKLLAHTLK